ncbi:MAG TPA: FISUMP domain-containing protein [Cyclobacteriaceae bacterium]|nr:FISUMP domain-containing protein [Cyclobacteriaceae bacterium]
MSKLLVKILYVCALCFIINQNTLAQQQKYALIIGVKSYQYVAPLQNSLNDAHDIAATLKKKGFTVVELYDPATKRVMLDGILKYFKLLQDQDNATGLVFYSGHGMQVKGVNYLIPTQANPQIEADLDDQCVNMDYVMRAIEQAGNELNIFIVDACRNNPFRSFSRTGEKGLSMVDTPNGSYIVYATKPGSVASDGSGRNGLFTSKLLKYMNSEGLNIEQVFKNVARDVAIASGDTQRPWIASDYTGDFFFTPVSEVLDTKLVTKPIVKPEPVAPTIAIAKDYTHSETSGYSVKVGMQTWFSKNLNVDHFANGDPIPEARTPEEWSRADANKLPAWCYYDSDPLNGQTYGKLYNWYAVNDSRGLAPKGWHIPNNKEWTVLIEYLGGEATAGLSIKSTTAWDENGNGNNSSGVEALPGGYRNPDGTFGPLGKYSNWWSSSEYNSYSAWYYLLSYSNNGVGRSSYSKGCGISVRCVRD